jgi:hypothetical protein
MRALLAALGFIGALELSAADWSQREGYRIRSVAPSQPGHAGFTTLAPAQTSVTFTNFLSDQAASQNQIRLNGSGVALGDVDGDGWCDLYLGGGEGPNALYRNLGGWRFEDITKAAGLEVPDQFSTGCVFADVDNDSDLDLLVNGLGAGTRLFRNDGHGHFSEDASAGLLRQYGAMSMALADIDGDGDLDLYVCNYRAQTIRSTGFSLALANGKKSILPKDRDALEIAADGHIYELGEPDALYLNDGKGHFTQVSWTGGAFLDEAGQPLAKAPRDWGQSVMMRDMNGDGAPDIYVCNDFQTPDRFWLNDGHGKFRALPTHALRNSSTFSMGVDFADINRDGHDDFIVLDMLDRSHARRMRQFNGTEAILNFDPRPQFDRNTLQLNRGDNTYAEIAYYAGIEATGWSWSPTFLDVDLDGYEDLLITAGHMFDMQDMDAEAIVKSKGPYRREQIPGKLLMYPRMASRNVALRNQRDLTFADAGAAWGFDAIGVSHGMALADLDNDGDLDVVINRLNDHALILRNESAAPRLLVRAAVGTKITLRGGPVIQSQQIISGGRYLSGDEGARQFAAGPTNELQFDWRDGRRSFLTNIAANSIIEATEPTNALAVSKSPPTTKAWFKKVSTAAESQSTPPIDNHLQPLLPWAIESSGVFLAANLTVTNMPPFSGWRPLAGRYPEAEPATFPNIPEPLKAGLVNGFAFADLDGDGDNDLIVASEWGPVRIFINDNNKFTDKTAEWGLANATGFWQCVAVGDFNGDKRPDLIAGNWSLNTKYRATAEHPLKLYYKDFDGNGSHELIEAEWDEAAKQEVPMRNFNTLAANLPFLREKIRTHKAFGEASITTLFGENNPRLEANTLATTLFLNTGNSFQRGELPIEAQFAPVFGAAVADFDSDGNLDVFLAQNIFAVAAHTTRADAGRGLLLQGNGHGGFRAVPAMESGIELYGEGRACRAGDFDGDGKIDLVVLERNGAVHKFHNNR